MSVSGPLGSCKIDLVFKMLLKVTLYPSYYKLFNFAGSDQTLFLCFCNTNLISSSHTFSGLKLLIN